MEFTLMGYSESAAHQDKSREWGRLKVTVESRLNLGSIENAFVARYVVDVDLLLHMISSSSLLYSCYSS